MYALICVEGIFNCLLTRQYFVHILRKCLPSRSTRVNVHLICSHMDEGPNSWFEVYDSPNPTDENWPQLLVAGKECHLIWGFRLIILNCNIRYCETALSTVGKRKHVAVLQVWKTGRKWEFDKRNKAECCLQKQSDWWGERRNGWLI